MAPPDTRAALTLARYKRLILLGKATLPLEAARRLVGPDCAYHLYFRHGEDRPVEETTPRRRGPRAARKRRHK